LNPCNISTGPEILLLKQFRASINKVVIEVLAGLVQEGESAEDVAVRELKEETGYIGKARETSPVFFNGEPLFAVFVILRWLMSGAPQILVSAIPA
jgi:ADP-ribose pyrophosphatase